ncbi:MAG TPA: hypothetical protein VJ818_06725 [Actinomycetota bacterium]|nr:hypothetical protein [Actinomycetota bacterium]
MAMTYGEEMLAEAEAAADARARKRSARKRRTRLLLPFLGATLWAMFDLMAARNTRLAAGGAGGIRLLFDHLIVIGWTLLFVIMPMAGALKTEPLPAGAGLAFIAGPVLTPILFGHGGWKWWQSAVVLVVTALVLVSSATRRRPLLAD